MLLGNEWDQARLVTVLFWGRQQRQTWSDRLARHGTRHGHMATRPHEAEAEAEAT
jgi:hypothetical protein